jgi:hypothetical protein
VKKGCQSGQGLGWPGAGDAGNFALQCGVKIGKILCQNGRRARRYGLFRKAESIRFGTPHGYKQIARLNHAGIGRYTTD